MSKLKVMNFINWQGWQGCYYVIALFWIFLISIIAWDMIYVFLNNGYPPLGLPIGSECCGWSYKSVQNHTIYGLIIISSHLICHVTIVKLLEKYSFKFFASFALITLIMKVDGFFTAV